MKIGTVAAALLAMLITIATLWPTHGLLLNWDEVDYINASRLGIGANMFDRGSLTPAQFIAFVKAKAHHQAPVSPESYDETTDPVVLRHFHPPFVFYLQALIGTHAGDRESRRAQLLGAAALLAALFFLYRSLSLRPTLAGLIALAIVGITACWILFSSISCHGWMAVWTTLTCGFVVRWRRQPSARNAVGIVVSVALAAITLESALLLTIAVIVVLAPMAWRWLRPPEASMVRWRAILVCVGGGIAFMMLLWPAGVFGLSIVKTAALYAYRLLAIGGREYSDVGAGYRIIVRNLAPCLLAALLGVWSSVRSGRDSHVDWRPVAFIGGIYTVALAGVAISPTYLLPGLVVLAALGVVALDRIPSIPIRIALIAALLALSTGPYRQLTEMKAEDAVVRQDVQWLLSVDTSALLADGGHVFSFYLGHPVPELNVGYEKQALNLRVHSVYLPLTQASIHRHFLLILKQRAGFFGPGRGEDQLRGCRRTDRVTFVLYDCRENNAQ